MTSGDNHSRLPPAVWAFLSAFNERSVAGMAACLAPAAEYVNLSHAQPFRGKQAVEAMLSSLVGGAPPDWQLAVLDCTADPSAAAVVFCMRDGAGRAVPLSQGLAFYRLNEAGLIAQITEATEQVFKLPEAALPAVGAAAPLLQALGGNPLAALLASGQASPAGGTAMQGQQLMPGSSSGGSNVGVGSSTSSSLDSSRLSGSPAPVPHAGAAPMGAVAATAAAADSSPQPGSMSSSSPPAGSLAALSGTWVKDFAASDLEAYSRACDLLQLGGLQKTTALQLIEGMEIEQRGQQVAVRYLTVVPFFKVTEEMQLGSAVSMGRRDLRQGTQQATAAAGPDGSLQVSISWAAPNAGSIEESYRLATGGDTLECLSTVTVAAGSATTRTVYRRSTSGWAPRYRWNPLSGIGLGGRSGQ